MSIGRTLARRLPGDLIVWGTPGKGSPFVLPAAPADPYREALPSVERCCRSYRSLAPMLDDLWIEPELIGNGIGPCLVPVRREARKSSLAQLDGVVGQPERDRLY